MKHVYIHIPFCNDICSYCDFCKMYYNKDMVSTYLKALDKEIKKIYRQEELETIYIGGGTPSCLNIDELEKLFKTVSQLNRHKDCEFTIECNFSSINYDKLLLFKEYGINRLSFGIESIDQNNLKILGRVEDKESIREKIDMCNDLGFKNINVDLMYAIPGEDINTLSKDIDFILSLNVSHVSTYSLMIEEHTRLYIDGVKNIDEDLDFSMYKHICERLKDKYIHYEISNFGKEGYFSKHNLCYWMNKNYYGFGLSASSYISDKRIDNTRSFNDYIRGDYDKNIELLTKEDKMKYEVILGLRTIFGINKEDFKEKYQCDIYSIYDIDKLINNKLIIDDGKKIYIPIDKWYISNEILLEFIKE